MYIKMVGDTTKYHGKLERISQHLIKVSGLIQCKNGFRLYLDNDELIGNYSNYVYPYNDPDLGEGVYLYSDNNMNYEEEHNRPSKQEAEQQKILSIVDKRVSPEIESISSQLQEMQATSLAMYSVLEEIIALIQPQTEEEQPTEEEIPQQSESEEEISNDKVDEEKPMSTKSKKRK